MTVEKILSKLTAVDGKEYYLLTSLHNGGEAGMDLALVRDNQAWTGTVTEEDLDGASQDLKMEYPEFVTQTRKALTRQNVGGIDFQYTCKVRTDTLIFTWKKHVSTENIKIQLGTTVLKEKDMACDVVTEIFEHALEATTRLQTTITTFQAENERLVSERATALKRLDKCVSNKNQMEEDMYSKFAIVINDKKAKIRSLRDQLNGVSSSVASSGDTAMAGESHSVKQEAGNETDDMPASRSGSDYDTDDGRNTPPIKKLRPVLKTEPSTDDNLLLDDSLAKTSTPVNPRRRRRQEAASKKTTPSRPVLPRPASKEPTPGTSRGQRASLRKGASNVSSNISSDNVDNLFDDF